MLFSTSLPAQERPAPEPATGRQGTAEVATGSKFMVVSAHPEATKAGYDILKRGGSAADAAVAVQMVLGLVEPQSSGIGGGAFALYYDARTGSLRSFDGRETAPVNAGKHLFTGQDGKPMAFYDAAIGGRAVGAPGVLRLLERLHEWQGRLPWRDVIFPAVQMAEQGFTVTPRLSQMVRAEKGRLDRYTHTRLYFYPDVVTPVQAGSVLRNPDYAVSLRKIAQDGADGFYRGELAQEIVKTVQEAPGNRGLLSLEDLAGYEAKERLPVCGLYREYKICSVGEPSSGGLTLLSALGMLEHFDMRARGADNPQSWHLIAEASRLAFADRNFYMADPDFVTTPGMALLNRHYLKSRADQISVFDVIPSVQPGTPPGWGDAPQKPDTEFKWPGTTHISIVDGDGNMVSMTSSIETAFGSRLMVGGFLLNNQLTDFAFVPERDGLPVMNRVEGGKRPRSSMTPAIIFDPSGAPFMIVGSAGGSRIIGYVLQRIVSVIDWDMDLQDALDAPNIVNAGGALEVEEDGGPALARPLEKFGHHVGVGEMNSGLTAILIENGILTGGADPRREGTAMGE